LPDIIGFLHRRWKFIAAITGLFVVAALVLSLVLTKQYTATTQILIEAKQSNVLGRDSIVAEGVLSDTAGIDSQISLITSSELLRRIVEANKLESDPDFGLAPEPGQLARFRGAIVGFVKSLLGSTDTATEEVPDTWPPEVLRAVGRLKDAIAVRRQGRTYVVDVAVTLPNARKAAKIANAVADAYIVDKMQTRFDQARRAADWLADRIKVMADEVRSAEQAVAAFRAKHNLLETAKGGTVTEQQMADLNTQLISLRAEVAEKRAKYEQAKALVASKGNIEAIPDVLRSSVISSLRNQSAQVTTREADLLARYGRSHPQVVNVQAERRDIERQIRQEVERIIANLKNEYDVVQSREASLTNSLGAISGQTGADNKVAVELRELERKATAARTLYESFLSRAKVAEEEATLSDRDARVISPAMIPGAASFPRPSLFLALGLVLGLALGTAGGIGLELLAPGFVTPKQVEEVLGLPVLSSIPVLGEEQRRVNGSEVSVPRYIMSNPLSHASEAVRSLRTGVQMSNVDAPPKLIQVTSALPSEGKSTLALALAFSAATSGQRVLLIDADLRHPSTSQFFGLLNKPGLVECLVADIDYVDTLHKDPGSGLHVLSAGGRTHHPPDLLGSERMRRLVQAAANKFDYVVIDSPPIAPVVDAAVISQLVDRIVFTVAWKRTPRGAVVQALRNSSLRTHKVAGIVLNMIDEKSMTSYGRYGYYGSKYYGHYYRTEAANDAA
jgi:exopolysaccharide transport family protein